MFFRRFTAKQNKQKGGSLIETLMTVGFFGMFAAGFSSMGVTQLKAINSMELRSELAVLKTTIATHIDCEKTARSVCQGKNNIYTRTNKMRLPGAKQVGGKVPMKTILEHLNEDMSASPDYYSKEDGTGQWQVAARCVKATRRSYDIYLYVARKNGDRFVEDPLTKRPWTWRDLFKGPICQSHSAR